MIFIDAMFTEPPIYQHLYSDSLQNRHNFFSFFGGVC